jgi:D-alanine-D-alanine ligase-like ATP-grasp enzyme
MTSSTIWGWWARSSRSIRIRFGCVLEHGRSELDLVFNNAEGFDEGELREAIVPFFCGQLGSPHTGSAPKTLINTLDRATAKRLGAHDGVATPAFQVMEAPRELRVCGLTFPLMVKPVAEGTSIGITQASRVHDDRELCDQVERILDRGGTEATMCGNGIRCAARYFRDHGCVTRSPFTIATDGAKAVCLENRWVTVDMGWPAPIGG